MKWRLVLALLLLPILAVPGTAGLFGKKPAPPNPADRVPELINILKTDGDENKRVAAAEELRQYDPAAFPLLVPALIDAAQNEKKPAVRSEAVQTLGKLRPPSQTIGQALEQARDKDPSMRVRMQARSSLLWYGWPGHHAGKTPEPPIQAKEPAAEATKGAPAAPRTPPSSPTAPGMPRSPKEQSVEPPLAQPVAATKSREMPLPVPPPLPPPPPLPATTSPSFRPMPPGPATTTVKMTEPPLASPNPPADVNKTNAVSTSGQTGPDLGPPPE